MYGQGQVPASNVGMIKSQVPLSTASMWTRWLGCDSRSNGLVVMTT